MVTSPKTCDYLRGGPESKIGSTFLRVDSRGTNSAVSRLAYSAQSGDNSRFLRRRPLFRISRVVNALRA